MACFKVSNGISLDCSNLNKGGTISRVILWNFLDTETITYDVTNENQITDIVLAAGTQAYEFTTNNGGSVEYTVNPSSELKQTDYRDGVAQSLQMVLPNRTPEDLEVIKDLIGGRFMAIAEAEDKGLTGEKAFMVFGVNSGLNTTENTFNLNDATQGNILITLGTKDIDPRIECLPYNAMHDTDYVTTKTKVDALLTPPAP